MVFACFSDSFKYFHTADTFAALVHASIWLRHVIVRYNLCGLFAYSAEHRNSFFAIFGRTISVAEYSVHPYLQCGELYTERNKSQIRLQVSFKLIHE